MNVRRTQWSSLSAAVQSEVPWDEQITRTRGNKIQPMARMKTRRHEPPPSRPTNTHSQAPPRHFRRKGRVPHSTTNLSVSFWQGQGPGRLVRSVRANHCRQRLSVLTIIWLGECQLTDPTRRFSPRKRLNIDKQCVPRRERPVRGGLMR